ncbi:MAG: glutamate racemase [Parachlamydiaceae bacterium]|nr:glutamate racemase [Parachlamydiaceae bacterium]
MQEKLPHLRSIGIFDSGVGGLTVMQQILHALPQENVVYFGDTARVPYGGKSRETVLRYSIENSIFLMEQDIKLLVIACNTASAYAGDKLKQVFNIPVVDVIAPAIQEVLKTTKNGRIAILGTRGTIQSGVYQKGIQEALPHAQITGIACPLLVNLVEEHLISHAATRMIVRDYLAPLRNKGIDTVVLGCTHYPLLRPMIEEELGNISIVDPALTCAQTVADLLHASKLSHAHAIPQHRYYVSDDPEKFRILGRDFLGMPLNHVEAIVSSDFRK